MLPTDNVSKEFSRIVCNVKVACEASEPRRGGLLGLGRVGRVYRGHGGAARCTHLLQVAGAVELQASLSTRYVYLSTGAFHFGHRMC